MSDLGLQGNDFRHVTDEQSNLLSKSRPTDEEVKSASNIFIRSHSGIFALKAENRPPRDCSMGVLVKPSHGQKPWKCKEKSVVVNPFFAFCSCDRFLTEILGFKGRVPKSAPSSVPLPTIQNMAG